jgi:hypothetical protein
MAAMGLALAASSALADARFDQAEAARRVVLAVADAFDALDGDRFLAALSADPQASVWNGAVRRSGRDAISALLRDLFAAREKGEFSLAGPRLLLDGEGVWATFAWTWGDWGGRAIALLRDEGGSWRLFALDLYGGTGTTPAPDFDPRPATRALEEAAGVMARAATAFSRGDIPALEPIIRRDFQFYDGGGRLWESAEALLVAALTPVPKGISHEAMTLYVADAIGRAIAFQTAEGRRVSLLLRREDATWQIQAASLGTPLETLAVRRRRTAMLWSRLRVR